jgi:EAL domain-containing protein (putative c-di-GMP-specific phosphodiesterase class I)
VSMRQLETDVLVEHVVGALASSRLDPGSLIIEVTESTLMRDAEATVTRLRRLKELGVMIAIDDFGTGYSSLSRLSYLPIDTLKIDRSFVGEMTIDPRAKKLVSSMISIARAFKMLVVAEGVESQEQLDALWQLGCDHSQGYLHCKPVTRDEFGELLRNGRGRFILPRDESEVAPVIRQASEP